MSAEEALKMRKLYKRFGIMLMTFALGLASVFIFNGSLKFSDEIYVNLPKVKTEKVITVFPRYSDEIPKPRIVFCKRVITDYELQKTMKSHK